MLVKIMKPDFIHEDDRGKLVQLVHDGWKQVNVITSKKGCERGGHYHRLNREAFYIINGSLKLTLELEGKTEETVFVAGDMFMIESDIMHDFIFLEDTCLISMYDNGVESADNTKDILR